MKHKGDYSQRGVAGKFMLDYLVKNATSDSLLCAYLNLFEEGLKLKNQRLIYFALNKIVDMFNKKIRDSHTVAVVFAQLVNKSTAEEIKAQGKIIRFAAAQLTRLSLYPDGCDITIEALSYLREVISHSESGLSSETEKETYKFDCRIKSALYRFGKNESIRTMGRKTLANQIPPQKRRNPVEEILKTWAIQK